MVDGTHIDRLMSSAWPAAVAERHGPWLFRFTDGVTRRANSVRVVGEPDDLDGAIAAAEAFYRSRGAQSVFLVSEASAPASVVDALSGRGYRPSATTWMLHATAAGVATADEPDARREIDATREVTERWLDVYRSVEADPRSAADRSIVRDVLLDPAAPARFVTLAERRAVVAVGQVVIDEGWGCLQCLATLPSSRRRGAGRRVVRRLAREAAAAGADALFAAVMADNDASLGLMEGLGFERLHRYRYYAVPGSSPTGGPTPSPPGARTP